MFRPPKHKGKKKTHFNIQNELAADQLSGTKSHRVYEGKKKPVTDKVDHPKYQKQWVMKEIKDPINGYAEVIAQELFRLFYRSQPKTRLVYGDKTFANEYYIASERLLGTASLSQLDAKVVEKNILTHQYEGLGKLCVLALFTSETDFRKTNVLIRPGVNGKPSQLIKIDGDLTFANLTDKKVKFDAESITTLPAPKGYEANNFLYFRTGGEANTSGFNNEAVQHDPVFRAEVNSILLKIILLPSQKLEEFVNAYTTPSLAQQFYHDLLTKKSALESAAHANPSFIAYIKTADLDQCAESFIKEMAEFKTSEKSKLIKNEEELKQFREGVSIRLKYLRERLIPKPAVATSLFSQDTQMQPAAITGEKRKPESK